MILSLSRNAAKRKPLTIAAMPASYTRDQKARITQLVAVTQSSTSAAAKALESNGWNVEAAANAFFAANTSTATKQHKTKLTKIFDKYRDSPADTPDEINMEGTMALLGDCGIEIESVDMLVFSELVGCPTLGTVTRAGFVDGLSNAGVSDLPKIATLVSTRSSQLSIDPSVLKAVYKHTFPLARAPGQKAVALDSATEYWRVLFTSPSLDWTGANGTPWLDWWLEFLAEKYGKSVNKDLWDQTLAFAQRTLADEEMGFWSEDSAWPGVIDEFVAYVKERRSGDGMEVE